MHGWVGDAGEELHALVTQRASCPPAALAELSRLERRLTSDAEAGAFGMLARALAENGHTDRAVSILDELRHALDEESGMRGRRQVQDSLTWQTARLLERAKRWESALEIFDELSATNRWDDLAINRSRAHCLLELADSAPNRLVQLEQLVFDNLTSDSSCTLLETLLAAWSRSSSRKGLADLAAGTVHSIRDPFSKVRTQAVIDARWNAAVSHRRALALPELLALEDLTRLIASGNHRREVQASLRAIGPSAIAYLRERANALSADQLHLFHELYSALAESGLPELESTIKAVNESSPGFPYLEIWREANALRVDLRPDRSTR